MLIEQRDVENNIFIGELLLHALYLFGRCTIYRRTHAKPIKTSTIEADFILFSAQQDKIFAALESSN